MRIVINAGHTKFGAGTGAKGNLVESIETRKVAYELMKLLDDSRHEVIPAVYDRSSNNLKDAVDLSNKAKADLFISIHLNAGGGKGCEAYTYKKAQHQEALNVCKNLNKLGFINRGVKDGSHLYVVKNTTAKAILIEVCFVDSIIDNELFKVAGYNKIAKAIYDAIV